MDSSKIIGSLCKHCQDIININDEPHVCSIIRPKYLFQKIQPKVHNSGENVPVSLNSSFSNLMEEIEIEELNISSVSESDITNDNLVENEMNNAQDFTKLIIAVRERHPLWYHRKPMSRRYETIKQKLWDEIYIEFNGVFSIVTLKKKWKYLKDKYVRQKRKLASGAGGRRKKNWYHMKALQFLDVVLMNNNKTSNINSLSDDIMSLPKPRTKAYKRSNNDAFEESISYELRQLRPLLPKPTENVADPDKSFGNYLISLMKSLPKKRKLQWQAEIISKTIAIITE